MRYPRALAPLLFAAATACAGANPASSAAPRPSPGPSAEPLSATRSPTPSETTAPNATTSPASDGCNGFTEPACDATPGCTKVFGALLVATAEGSACFDKARYVACRATPEGCGDGETHFCHASGATYRGGDTCTPTDPAFHACSAPLSNVLVHVPSCGE